MTRWQRLRHWWTGGHRWVMVRAIWPYKEQWFFRCAICERRTVTVDGDPYESEDAR